MRREYDWHKLRDNNCSSIVYGADCQVVAAVNAYYRLTGEVAYKSERAYRSLCKLAGAHHGSAIRIEKVHEKLGIRRGKTRRSTYGCFRNPIECFVWHRHYGFHNVLIVDRVRKCDTLRVANFREVTHFDGWMFRGELDLYINATGFSAEKGRCWPLMLI